MMRLNLGCGPGPALEDSYLYIDASRKLLIAKIPLINFVYETIFKETNSWDKRVKFKNVMNLKLKRESIEYIYSSHLLEHLYLNQCIELVQSLYESLKIGGRIRFALPDYDKFIDQFVSTHRTNPLLASQNFQKALLSGPSEKPHLKLRIWQFVTGDLHVHRWHPNFAIVEDLLQKAGFKDIKRCDFQSSKIFGIEKLENRDEMTFFIEAVK
jgi:SAM-dependent methyltransferase